MAGHQGAHLQTTLDALEQRIQTGPQKDAEPLTKRNFYVNRSRDLDHFIQVLRDRYPDVINHPLYKLAEHLKREAGLSSGRWLNAYIASSIQNNVPREVIKERMKTVPTDSRMPRFGYGFK